MTASLVLVNFKSGDLHVRIRQNPHTFEATVSRSALLSMRALMQTKEFPNSASLDAKLKELGVDEGLPEPARHLITAALKPDFPDFVVDKTFSDAELEDPTHTRGTPPKLSTTQEWEGDRRHEAVEDMLVQATSELSRGANRPRRAPYVPGREFARLAPTDRMWSVTDEVWALAKAKVSALDALGYEPERALLNISKAVPNPSFKGWRQASSAGIDNGRQLQQRPPSIADGFGL